MLQSVDPKVSVFLLFGIASVLALFEAWRRNIRVGSTLPLACAIASAAPLFSATLGLPVLIAAGSLMWRSLRSDSIADSVEPTSKPERIAGVMLLSLIAAALTYRLESFSSEALTWEATTIFGLAADLKSGESIFHAASMKALWGDAALSDGGKSLIFALPVLTLFKYFSASLVSMRVVALIYFIAACAVFSRFAGRTFGGITSLISLAIIALSEPSLLYARYGVAVSASLFFLVVALSLCERLVSTLRLPLAILAPAALYAATLGYAPARIPVTVMAIFTNIGLLSARSFSLRRRMVSATIFSLIIASVILYQYSEGSLRFFLGGRGEQIFAMISSEDFPTQLVSRPAPFEGQLDNPLLPGEKIGIAFELVRQITAEQLAMVLSPFNSASSAVNGTKNLRDDPIYWPIIAPVLTPFVLLGFVVLVKRGKLWLSGLLLLWTVSYVGAILLTNRVDSHRAFFLIVPLVIWAALGADALFRSFSQWFSTAAIGITALAAVLILALPSRMELLYPIDKGISGEAREFIDILKQVPGPISVLSLIPDVKSARIRLSILERNRGSSSTSLWVTEGDRRELSNTDREEGTESLEQLNQFLKNGGTIVASPSIAFLEVARLFMKRGADLRRLPGESSDFLLISMKPFQNLDHLGFSFDLPDLPPPLNPPVRSVPLSSIAPDYIEPCLGRPKVNSSHDSNMLQMNKVRYASGLGFHADVTIGLPVPSGATALKALIGIDDEVLPCSKSSAIVSVLGPDLTPLFTSPVLHSSQEPTDMLVSLSGERRLFIKISGTKDGSICDHVDLANAEFILSSDAPASGPDKSRCVCLSSDQ